jgi:hypothetical protein
MTKEEKLLNQMVKVTNKYCDLLEEFHKTMDERNYEYTEEQLEKLETLRDHTDTIYDNMSVINDHQDIIVKTLEDIKTAIGYEEEKSYLYIVDGCDKESFMKDYKLCKALEEKLSKDGTNVIVATSDMLENMFKTLEDKNENAANFIKNMLKEREEKHITHDQLVEMVNN